MNWPLFLITISIYVAAGTALWAIWDRARDEDDPFSAIGTNDAPPSMVRTHSGRLRHPLNLRRTGTWISNHVNVFAVFYLAGLMLIVWDIDSDPTGWDYVRTVVWVLGAPASYILGMVERGIHLRQKSEREDSPVQP